MGDAYPELTRGSAHAQRVLKTEEERFAETLANGMVLLEGAIRDLHCAKVIDGNTVFKLYDTYGFPADLTAAVARERGPSIDQARFEAAMEEQRRRSQDASKFGSADPRGGASFDARTPPGGCAQSQRHASAARGAAQGARRPRAAEGIAGGARPAALRFRAFSARHRRGAARDRTARECADPRQHPGGNACHGLCGRGGRGRHRVVWREIRQGRAGTAPG